MTLRVGRMFHKRDWGGCGRTWRPVPATQQKYPQWSVGPTEFSIRRLSSRRAKHELLHAPTGNHLASYLVNTFIEAKP